MKNCMWFVLLMVTGCVSAFGVELKVSMFQVDATPPLGSALCGGSVDPAKEITDPLTARGMILLPEDQDPIVIAIVDWVGIGNDGHTLWRRALAEAVETSLDRVTLHTIHQHDAPFCDFTVETLMRNVGLPGKMFDPEFAEDVIARSAVAANESLSTAVSVTHLGLGKAKVEQVASNRRILGEDGKVAHVRWTACTDPMLREEPEGTIDPWLRAISLWNGDTPVAILTHYATHPQSHYGKGSVSADFPGMARTAREQAIPEARHFHFNGAGGNIGAGKYNDGSPSNRPVLAGRLEDGMKAAFDSTTKYSLADLDVDWATEDVMLPLRDEVSIDHERKVLHDENASIGARMGAAREIAWIERIQYGEPITIGRLQLGPAQILYMPGELFVEYQLAAQAMAPESFVSMAAYGDYAPGYIGTTVSYGEGGYETGVHTSRTAPEVEPVLMNAMKALLRKD